MSKKELTTRVVHIPVWRREWAYSRADCDCVRSWVKMEGVQIAIREGVGLPLRVGSDQS